MLFDTKACLAEVEPDWTTQEVILEEENEERLEGQSLGMKVLLYVPNRLLDLLDIVRVRVRVGPGFGAGVRVTRAVSAQVTSYASGYIGLPGPRQDNTILSPVGAEVHSGVGLSYLNAETEVNGPNYSETEVGADIHLMVAGISVGFDPLEIADFIVGFAGFEIVDDEL